MHGDAVHRPRDATAVGAARTQCAGAVCAQIAVCAEVSVCAEVGEGADVAVGAQIAVCGEVCVISCCADDSTTRVGVIVCVVG